MGWRLACPKDTTDQYAATHAGVIYIVDWMPEGRKTLRGVPGRKRANAARDSAKRYLQPVFAQERNGWFTRCDRRRARGRVRALGWRSEGEFHRLVQFPHEPRNHQAK